MDKTKQCVSGLHVSRKDYDFANGSVRISCRVFPKDIIAIDSEKIRCTKITPLYVIKK
jgi:hypothetical protein